MADQYLPPTDDEQTKVSPVVDPAAPEGPGSPSGTPAAEASTVHDPSPVEPIDAPATDPVAAAADAAAAAAAAATAAQAAAAEATRLARAAGVADPAPPVAAEPLTPAAGVPASPPSEDPSLRSRAAEQSAEAARIAAERAAEGARFAGQKTAEGAKIAAEKTAVGARIAADGASRAASATVQAIRETDVNEIARSTTGLIENTRPFFLTLFALGFAVLAAFENHAAVGVSFGIASVLCVLGAAYSREIDLLLTGRATGGRSEGGSGD